MKASKQVQQQPIEDSFVGNLSFYLLILTKKQACIFWTFLKIVSCPTLL